MSRVPLKVERRVVKYDTVPVEYGPPVIAFLGVLRHVYGARLGVDPRDLRAGVRYVNEVFRGKTPLRAVKGVVYVVSKLKPSLAPSFNALKGADESVGEVVRAVLLVARMADTFSLPYLVVAQLPTLYAQYVGLASVMNPKPVVIPGLRFPSMCFDLAWGSSCYVMDGEKVGVEELLSTDSEGMPKVRPRYEVGAAVADKDLFTIAYASNLSTIYSLLGMYAVDVNKYVHTVLPEPQVGGGSSSSLLGSLLKSVRRRLGR